MKTWLRLLVFGILSAFSTSGKASQVLGEDYFRELVQPLFEQRCIQCHSCYNAPCQLNMSSGEGIDRGLVQGFDVFSPRKLRAAEPSRLGIDRKTTQEWRNFSWDHRFMPVVQDTGYEYRNLDTSFILRLVEHKQKNADLQVDDLRDFDNQQAENSRVCPDTTKELERHLRLRPSAGMPYGLPALSEREADIIRDWTRMGSPVSGDSTPRPAEDLGLMRGFEAFLNRSDLRSQLVSRYLYEHLFLAHLYLRNETDPKHYYSLIRSRTACDSGKLDEIATRRPWNDPGAVFHYCLKRVNTSIVHKTHLTYRLDPAKVQRFQKLFFEEAWPVRNLPSRSDEQASNPFLTFQDIPIRARYQFLLDDAEYHVMTFIKGPVCKGNTAVNSIDEQFYVIFINPDSDLMVKSPEFARKSIPELILPAYKGSDQFAGLRVGRHIRESRNRYRVLRDQAYGQLFPEGYSLQDIWKGDDFANPQSQNLNAALTVFRHHDSSAVVKGLVGATSKTAFVLDYSLFERLVYSLVTGFDVYGDVSHQIHTRLYMSYIRMESEENFLSFLPSSVRTPMRKSWYVPAQGVTEKIGDVVNTLLVRDLDKVARRFPLLGLDKKTQIPLSPLNVDDFYRRDANFQHEILRAYRRDFFRLVKSHLGKSIAYSETLNPDKTVKASTQGLRISEIRSVADFERELSRITDIPAMNAPWVLKLPSFAPLVLETGGRAELYSLMRSKEHFNIAWIAGEDGRRNFAADSLQVYKGISGSYPNQIFVVKLENAQNFLQDLIQVQSPQSYDLLLQKYGSPRHGPGSEKFWENSDRLHAVFRATAPIEYGIFDYNRFGIDFRSEPLNKDVFGQGLPASMKDLLRDGMGEEP